MAFPKKSHRQGSGGSYTFDNNPTDRPRVDARTAVHRDMDGNVISQPGERAFTDIHRGMGGEPLSGKSILNGSVVNFPKPGVRVDSRPDAQGPGRDGLPIAAPRSGMETGNGGVAFKSAAERAAAMNGDAANKAAAVSSTAAAVAAKAATPTGQAPVRDEDYVNEGLKLPGTLGVVGSGPDGRSGSFPKARILEGDHDVTPDYAAGGKYSSVPAHDANGQPKGPRIVDETGDRTPGAAPAAKTLASGFPRPAGSGGPTGAPGPTAPAGGAAPIPAPVVTAPAAGAATGALAGFPKPPPKQYTVQQTPNAQAEFDAGAQKEFARQDVANLAGQAPATPAPVAGFPKPKKQQDLASNSYGDE